MKIDLVSRRTSIAIAVVILVAAYLAWGSFSGGGLPAEIWHEVMVRINEGVEPKPLPKEIPPNTVTPVAGGYEGTYDPNDFVQPEDVPYFDGSNPNQPGMTGGTETQSSIARVLTAAFLRIQQWVAPIPEPLQALILFAIAGVFIWATLRDRRRSRPLSPPSLTGRAGATETSLSPVEGHRTAGESDDRSQPSCHDTTSTRSAR